MDLRRAVAATRYPPAGTRGFAAMHRASRYGTVTDFGRRANAEACVIVQIETPEAVARLDEIAQVDGVDAIFAGPGDLSAACGHIGNVAHPDVQAHLHPVVIARQGARDVRQRDPARRTHHQVEQVSEQCQSHDVGGNG